MEEILFGSHATDIELSFNLSDHSVSSDDDLLPISVCKSRSNGVQSLPTHRTDDRTGDYESTSGDKKSNCDEISVAKTSDMTFYKCCPICQGLGPKSIQHIKQCANKRSIDPKRVVQLLSKCQKTDQLVDSSRCTKRYYSKTKHKSKDLSDNYVIRLEPGKPLKLSVNSKLMSDKNKYELSLLDANQRHQLLMSKINDKILSKKDAIIIASDQLVADYILPKMWTLSLLDAESAEYFVDGFHKYNQLMVQ